MTKPVRVPEDVHETLRRISAKHDVSMSEAARLALGDGLDDGTVLLTEQELEQRLDRAAEAAREGFRTGYETALIDAVDDSEMGAVRSEMRDRNILVADPDRYLDRIADVAEDVHGSG